MTKKFFKELHKIEKKVAEEVVKANIRAMKRENRFCRSCRKRLRKFIASIETLIPESKISEVTKNAKLLSNNMRQEISAVEKDTRKYFKSLIKLSDEVTSAIDKNYNSILKKTRKLREEVSDGTEDDDHKEKELFLAAILLLFGKKQKGKGVKLEDLPELKIDIFQVDKDAIEKFLIRKWTKDGKTWIDRLEEMKAGSSVEFKRIFEKGLKDGKGYREIIRETKKKIAVNGVRLERIIRTEGQRIQNDITMATYNRNQRYISGIEFTAQLDIRTCQICGSYDRNQYFYDGASNNLPDVLSAPYIPVHAACRCLYVPISKFWEGFGTGWQRKRASEFGPVTGDFEDFLRRKQREGDTAFIKKHLGKFFERWEEGTSIKTLKFTPQSTVADFLKREKLRRQRRSKLEASY